MPLTPFQLGIFQLIAANRNPDSFAAGGIVINRHERSTRFSDDIDIFHETAQAVAVSTDIDVETLRKAGYSVEFLRREETFLQAKVSRGDDYIRLDWAADSAYRFFPIVPDEVLGYRLHDADAATNKVLAAVGRQKVRDFIDLMQLDRDYISLGIAVWAAVDKDEGYTSALIMEFLRRNSLINKATLDGVTLVEPETPVALKAKWLERFDAANRLISTIPKEPIGCLYLDRSGQPAHGDVFDPRWVPHFGSVGGAWPKIVTG
jgi:hypothetical protein